MADVVVFSLFVFVVAVGLPLYALASAIRAWRQTSALVEEANVRVEEPKGRHRSTAEAGHLRSPSLHLSRASWIGGLLDAIGFEGPGSLELRMDGHGIIPPSVTMQRSGIGEAAGVVTGDTDFDSKVWVQGNEAQALGALGAQARDLLISLIWEGHATLQGGGIALRVGAADVTRRVLNLERLAQVLRELHMSGPVRLARNVRSDFDSGVRLRNLTVLQATYPDSPEAHDVSREAMGSPLQALRLAGAAFLDHEGWPALRQIVESADCEAPLRLVALVHYCCTAPVPDAMTVLASLGPERRAWLTQVEDTGAPTPVLLDLMDGGAKRLARVRDVTREPVLLGLMEFVPPAMQTALAKALGRVGTREAVAPLLAWVEQSGDQAIAHAARTAIARIQSRLGDAEAGRLSVAGAAEATGALTVADPHREGALSPASRGEVSTPDGHGPSA